MWYVFDCYAPTGYLCRVPFLWLAKVLAHAATKRTGRFHDYGTVNDCTPFGAL
jgi:hypothetical protein